MLTAPRLHLSPRAIRTMASATIAAIVGATLPASLAAPAQPVEPVGEAEHTVVMGAVDPAIADTTPRPPASAGRTDRFEYLAYYPDHLRVHRGDTVRFRRDGFHTVTFSPAGEPRRSWLRRDESAGVAAVEFRDPMAGCGHDPGLPACVLSSASSVLSSGWDDLAVTVDLDVGTYEYYCTVHEGMQGAVEVVPAADPIASPAEVSTARAEQVAADTVTAAALLAANQKFPVEYVGDHLRWTVKAGDITADDRVAVLRYMPSNLTIAPADEVVFVVPGVGQRPAGRDEDGTEIHTATFPHDPVLAQFGLVRYLNPACDPDDPRAGASGVPAQYPAVFAGCPPGTNFELLLHPTAWTSPTRAPDDTVLTPLTVHDTGLLGPDGDVCRTACDPWTQTGFPARSPNTTFPTEGNFPFVCLVHPEWGMAGSITVSQ